MSDRANDPERIVAFRIRPSNECAPALFTTPETLATAVLKGIKDVRLPRREEIEPADHTPPPLAPSTAAAFDLVRASLAPDAPPLEITRDQQTAILNHHPSTLEHFRLARIV